MLYKTVSCRYCAKGVANPGDIGIDNQRTKQIQGTSRTNYMLQQPLYRILSNLRDGSA